MTPALQALHCQTGSSLVQLPYRIWKQQLSDLQRCTIGHTHLSLVYSGDVKGGQMGHVHRL